MAADTVVCRLPVDEMLYIQQGKQSLRRLFALGSVICLFVVLIIIVLVIRPRVFSARPGGLVSDSSAKNVLLGLGDSKLALKRLALSNLDAAGGAEIWVRLIGTPDIQFKIKVLRQLLKRVMADYGRFPAWSYPACVPNRELRVDACQVASELVRCREAAALYLDNSDQELRTVSALVVASLTPSDRRVLSVLAEACVAFDTLSSDDRYDAASALGILDLGSPVTQNKLLQVLEVDDAALRADAVIELGMLGAKGAQSKLLECLDDSDEWVRLMCLQTLRMLGCRREAAVRSMLPCLLRGESERGSAVAALNSICNGPWRNDLIALINKKNADVMGMGATALQMIYGLDNQSVNLIGSLASDGSVSVITRLQLIHALAKEKGRSEVDQVLRRLFADKDEAIRRLVVEIYGD